MTWGEAANPASETQECDKGQTLGQTQTISLAQEPLETLSEVHGLFSQRECGSVTAPART